MPTRALDALSLSEASSRPDALVDAEAAGVEKVLTEDARSWRKLGLRPYRPAS